MQSVRPRVKQSTFTYFLGLYILNKVVLLTILTKWTIESRETAPFKQVIPFFTGHADYYVDVWFMCQLFLGKNLELQKDVYPGC